MTDLNVHDDCELCSEHQTLTGQIREGCTYARHVLCGPCWETETFTCPDCHENFWNEQGTRVFSTPDLYCQRCTRAYPHVAAGRERESRRDIARDDFEQVRR